MRYVYSFLSASILAAIAYAQGQAFQGEVVSDSTRDFAQLTVELSPAAGTMSATERAFVAIDGRFDFRNVAAGQYLLVIKDREGNILHQQHEHTQRTFGRVSVRIPETKRERPVSGLVSVQELRHQPPKAALKAFRQSVEKAGKGDFAASLSMLERAVHLDAEYVPALNNLGVQFIRAGRYPEAADCFRRAIAISPKSPMLHGNLAQALLFLREYPAAETSARTAIALDSTDPNTSRAQLALALALAGRGAIADARNLLVTCTHSADDVVRRQAEGVLTRWKQAE